LMILISDFIYSVAMFSGEGPVFRQQEEWQFCFEDQSPRRISRQPSFRQRPVMGWHCQQVAVMVTDKTDQAVLSVVADRKFLQRADHTRHAAEIGGIVEDFDYLGRA